MSCIALSDLRKEEELHCCMPSLVVMLYQPSVVKEINLHDRSGTCVVADVRGPEKGRGITLFHAFTGCDVVSAFRGKGNKSA